MLWLLHCCSWLLFALGSIQARHTARLDATLLFLHTGSFGREGHDVNADLTVHVPWCRHDLNDFQHWWRGVWRRRVRGVVRPEAWLLCSHGEGWYLHQKEVQHECSARGCCAP